MVIDAKVSDGLLADYRKPEDLLGENGLLKQLTKGLPKPRCKRNERARGLREARPAGAWDWEFEERDEPEGTEGRFRRVGSGDAAGPERHV